MCALSRRVIFLPTKATTNRLVVSRIPDKASGVRRRQKKKKKKKSEYNSAAG